MKINSISGLIKKNAFPDIPTILTQYLQNVGLPLTLQVPIAVDETTDNVPHPEPHVDELVDPLIEPSVCWVSYRYKQRKTCKNKKITKPTIGSMQKTIFNS